jgi:hypothetical protein
MIDYNNGKIYKIEPICDYEEGDIYIGSTTKKYLSDRMCDHRADYKRKKEGKRGPNSFVLFDKYGVENCKIHLIMLYPCNTKDELLAKEGEYIRTLNCVNKVIPNRTKQEYDKEYRIKMKDNEEYQQKRKDYRQNVFEKTEKRINYLKEYRENNKEKTSARTHDHYIKNKEKKQEYEKQRYEKNKEKLQTSYICVCGCSITVQHKKRHEQTKKHLGLMEAKKAQQDPGEINHLK